MAYKYFLYSHESLSEQNEILAKVGKKYVPGMVMVGASRHPYTDISDTPKHERYYDARVVAEGELKQMTYSKPSRERI